MSQTAGHVPPISVERLQGYLRRVVAGEREVIAAAPFTVFLDPHSPSADLNYAIPDRPIGGELRGELRRLGAVFAGRGRRPRVEYIDEFAPSLAPALRSQGFAEQLRRQMMICTNSTYRPALAPAGLAIISIDADAPLELIHENLDVNNRGFDPHAPPIGAGEAARFRDSLGSARLFSARLGGHAAAAGMYTTPIEGMTELAGITTLEEFRRRGIAAALTSHIVAAAFASGVDVVCLSAADERAGRVYERVGFLPFATLVVYIAPEGGELTG